MPKSPKFQISLFSLQNFQIFILNLKKKKKKRKKKEERGWFGLNDRLGCRFGYFLHKPKRRARPAVWLAFLKPNDRPSLPFGCSVLKQNRATRLLGEGEKRSEKGGDISPTCPGNLLRRRHHCRRRNPWEKRTRNRRDASAFNARQSASDRSKAT